MTDKLKELVAKHPLPWTANILMIRDANGRQVLHLGGSRDEIGRGIDPDFLVEMNKLLVKAANEALAEQAPAGELQPPKRRPINAECPLCQAKFIVFTLGPWRASDLAEQRDPAAKPAEKAKVDSLTLHQQMYERRLRLLEEHKDDPAAK